MRFKKRDKMSTVLLFVFILVAVVFYSGIPGPAHAEGQLNQWLIDASSLPSRFTLSQPLALAENETEAPVAPAAEVPGESHGFRMDKAHKYLGYTTLLLAVGAAVSSSSEDLHKALGYSAAGMATMTCVTGYLEYSDYFTLDDGWSKTNIHIVSGVAATAGFIVTAILGSEGNDHGGIGGASTVLMAVPIVILKW